MAGRPRLKDELDLNGIPYTTPGAGLRVGRKTKRTGLIGLGEILPRPIVGAVQSTAIEMPTECGRCKSAALTFQKETATPGTPRRVSCFMCGWNAFFVTPLLAQAIVLAEPSVGRLKLVEIARAASGHPEPPPAMPNGRRGAYL